jgi:hypothetical protein
VFHLSRTPRPPDKLDAIIGPSRLMDRSYLDVPPQTMAKRWNPNGKRATPLVRYNTEIK